MTTLFSPVLLSDNSNNKSADKLTRVLPSFKQPLLSVDVMVGMYDNIIRYPI